ncbi:helix-turn-helix domain-containing protein [Streptococcus marmotae]|uniref:helix-turn-helix domain-containing protein n=1 Tax=Streptococcus marmotae TaxID=1825069 RepID=UPI0008375D68|nr:helix-turn-helix transcriptional regulator [Streptococcus marmotae]
MRWDIGKVYKEIRKSKGLSQKAVVGNDISRQSLISFEKGESTPRYETMEYLLRQIDMSFAEFEYICNQYQPSLRQEIYIDFINLLHSSKQDAFQDVLQKCEIYLKANHDIPIQRLADMLQVVYYVKQNGINSFSTDISIISEKLWKDLEKQDTWYRNDLRILNAILYHFPLETVHLMTDKILETLEKYKDYENIHNLKLVLLGNLSTIYLYHSQMDECSRILRIILPLAKQQKRYDKVAFTHIRLGICLQDDEGIKKGLTLLEAIEENELLALAKEEIEKFAQTSPDKKNI